jgi:hypothetical protein
MPKKARLKLPYCFAGTYKTPVWMRGTLVCVGGFGQPKCPHIQECIEQYRQFGVPEKITKQAIRRFVTNNKN